MSNNSIKSDLCINVKINALPSKDDGIHELSFITFNIDDKYELELRLSELPPILLKFIAYSLNLKINSLSKVVNTVSEIHYKLTENEIKL